VLKNFPVILNNVSLIFSDFCLWTYIHISITVEFTYLVKVIHKGVV